MRRLSKVLPAIVFASVVVTSLHANPVVATSGSWDGPGQNLNNYFSAWGVSSNPNYVNTGQLNGSTDWESAIPTGSSSEMILEVAGDANGNTFGTYQVINGTYVYNQIFSGPQTAGATATLTIPNGVYGFYLQFDGTYFYSDDNLYPTGQGQLAAYQGPVGGTTISTSVGNLQWNNDTYMLAWEDLPYASSDQDFNDMVILIDVPPSNVPDGGSTALLLGASMLILAVAARRPILKSIRR